jgi:hypothetical protein
MPDDPKEQFKAVAPWAQFPVVFCDGIMSEIHTPGVSKIFLYRSDPDPHAVGDVSFTPVMQIVMPMESMVKAAAFLAVRIQTMVNSGFITQERVNELGETFQQVRTNVV